MASWPLDASPTTSRSAWCSSTSRKPGAHQRLVVGEQDADRSSAVERAAGRGRGSRRRRAGPLERAAVEPTRSRMPTRPWPPPPPRGRAPRAAAVVGDLQLDRARPRRTVDPRAGRAGVLGRVGERLLHDRNAARSTPAGSAAGSSSTRSVDREPGRARPLGEHVDAVPGRAARPSSSAAGGPRAARARPAPRVRGDSISPTISRGARGVALDERLGAARLDRDHADVVGDGVVQLARDARALARHARRAPPAPGARSISRAALGGPRA